MTALFPDCDPASLDWEASKEGIAWRILARGGFSAMRWLRASVGDDAIRTMINSRQGRGLDASRLRFWQHVLGIPEETVSAWLAAPERRIWDRRTT